MLSKEEKTRYCEEACGRLHQAVNEGHSAYLLVTDCEAVHTHNLGADASTKADMVAALVADLVRATSVPTVRQFLTKMAEHLDELTEAFDNQ